jgi:hypothetical protein
MGCCAWVAVELVGVVFTVRMLVVLSCQLVRSVRALLGLLLIVVLCALFVFLYVSSGIGVCCLQLRLRLGSSAEATPVIAYHA